MNHYRHRFIELIAYIEANLDLELDVEKLCDVVHLSKHHFHRQCSAYFGMTVMSLVRLLRLKRAAYQLAFREQDNVVSIALQNGYQSHEAFSRVFKQHFKLSPSEFRNQPDWVAWRIKYQPILALREKIMSENYKFNVDVVEFPETLIAVIEHRGAPNLLGASILKFINWRKENALPPTKSKTFNLVYDDPNVTAPQDYRFDVGCEVTKAVAGNDLGIINKVIPSGKCAKIRHIGSDDAIGAVVNFLYSYWLEDSDYELRDFPVFYERVSFFPEVTEREMVTDVYLPLI